MSQTLTLVNRSSETWPDLILVVEPNRQPGVFHLKRLSGSDGQPIEGYTLEGARLNVPLITPIAPGATIGFALSYELDLPNRPGPFGYTARQTNLGDWYPFAPVYRAGAGWVVHEPAVVGEHLVYDVADYEVEISLTDPVSRVVIAASAALDGNADRYKVDAARSFAWSASAEYQISNLQHGALTVTAYTFPEHTVSGEAALQATANALALYGERFAPYPHASLSLVEADFPDGMEYDGLYFLGEEYYAAYAGSPQNYLTAIAAHETAHQWWSGLVGNDQAEEPWLDEALATYSERLYYATMHPELVDWWWEFRVTRFAPTGWVNSAIYDHNEFRSYVDAVYLRGAQFIEALRRLIGDAAFDAFLRDYTSRGREGQLTSADFFKVLAAHTPADLEPLIAQYFQR